MTASALVTVFCDGPSCGQWTYVEKTARLARSDARKGGWRCALPGGCGLCPSCVGAGVTPPGPYGNAPIAQGDPA